MPYEKYIKKNGKIYGPYLYKSKRVGDKVISEYVGEKKPKKVNSRKFSLGMISLVVVLLVLAFVFFFLNSKDFSGKAISDTSIVAPEKPSSLTRGSIDSGTIPAQTANGNSFYQTIRNYKNWVIVTFKMGDNQAEYSYSNSLSQEDLNLLIERDKTAWLEKISS